MNQSNGIAMEQKKIDIYGIDIMLMSKYLLMHLTNDERVRLD